VPAWDKMDKQNASLAKCMGGEMAEKESEMVCVWCGREYSWAGAGREWKECP